MTVISWTECDRCGARAEPAEKIYLYSLQDIAGCIIGHLCSPCAHESLPHVSLERWG